MCSLPPQLRDEGACPGELSFKICRHWRMATITHRFKRRVDLAERSLRHSGVPASLGEDHKRDALLTKTVGPGERHPREFVP
jgi:hypothetical protein